jgi:tetratricopeptide (TPR) repeat protein
LLTGILSKPLELKIWDKVKAAQPQLQLKDLEEGLGQGITIGLLGGFRSLVADGLWLKTNNAWEQRDLPATQTLIGMVTSVDPRPLYFWINGARMVAYDMPMWRIEAVGRYEDVPASVRDRIMGEHGILALEYLETGLLHHPEDPILYVEMAMIYHRKLNDMQKALKYYRLAAIQPEAPFYIGRLYAELLRRAGQTKKAYQWLITLYPILPKGNIWAMPDVVLRKIRELEEELGIEAENRYQP